MTLILVVCELIGNVFYKFWKKDIFCFTVIEQKFFLQNLTVIFCSISATSIEWSLNSPEKPRKIFSDR